jgi:chemotaxis protein MotB
MAKKKKQTEEAPAQAEWLATYCDMVTLLFAFFVLMFAMSQVDVGKWDIFVLVNRGDFTQEQLDSYIAVLMGPEALELSPDELQRLLEQEAEAAAEQASAEWTQTLEEIMAHITGAGMADRVAAYLGDDYIFINFIDDVLFAPNSGVIRSDAIPLIDAIGNALLDIEDEIGMIRINGHTAAIPDLVGVYHISDRVLSSERADAVLMRFEDVIGIEGRKLTALSFGKNFPLPGADNNTEEGRARNRRIEIVVTQPQTRISLELGEVYARNGYLSGGYGCRPQCSKQCGAGRR